MPILDNMSTYCRAASTRFAGLIMMVFLAGCGHSELKLWHTEKLTAEFTRAKADEVTSFHDYLALEERLFKQLDEEIYARSNTGPAYKLDRYSAGSAADPRKWKPDWNRSFELTVNNPRGTVLLLHGMSDSPYSLRALGKALNEHGYWVVGLRLPGHGTIPSGLRFIDRHDMTAAVRLTMTHLATQAKHRNVHIVGYSTGATLALEYTLDALEDKISPTPSSLILISPAIAIHPAAAMAGMKNGLANIPGLAGLAYLQIQPEFDPYKYNSFATNASTIVHRLTESVALRLRERAKSKPKQVLPPTLVFKSTVDATVTTNAVVDNLLINLQPHRHELVLFDINRSAAVKSRLVINDPAPLTDRVMHDAKLPFAVTLVTNQSPKTTKVVSMYKPPYSTAANVRKPMHLAWPAGVISQSHVSLPFPPDDPLYGQRPPDNQDFLFLGQMAIQGERGLLQIPIDWVLRLRYNPFYKYIEDRSLQWFDRIDATNS